MSVDGYNDISRHAQSRSALSTIWSEVQKFAERRVTNARNTAIGRPAELQADMEILKSVIRDQCSAAIRSGIVKVH